jgi:hypothetical protein
LLVRGQSHDHLLQIQVPAESGYRRQTETGNSGNNPSLLAWQHRPI